MKRNSDSGGEGRPSVVPTISQVAKASGVSRRHRIARLLAAGRC